MVLARGTPEPPLARVLGRAAGDAVNRVVMGAFAVTALMSGSLWLLAFGVATYAFLVSWKATGQECWQEAIARDRPKAVLPDPFHLADPLLRRCVSALMVARSETLRLLKSSSPELRRRVAGLPAGIDWLEAWAAHSLARIEELDRHLALINRVSLQDEEERLARLARSSSDVVAQREYERARQVRLQHLASIEELGRIRTRLTSTLQRVVAAVESLPTQLMHLLLLESADGGVPAPELDLELDHLRSELEIAEESEATAVSSMTPLAQLS
jgi:hypothetical protein